MILIRFADLLDLAKDRVSYYILVENIKHMSPTSQFHWISHYVTDKYELKSNYETDTEDTHHKDSPWLVKGAIKEIIKFNLHLNTKQLTTTTDNECRCCKFVECTQDLENNVFSIAIPDKPKQETKRCSTKKCSLLCKWMITKHEYLFNELFALVRYLSTVDTGLFTNEVVVNIYYDDKRVLEPHLMDSVVAYLNK